MSQSAPRRKHGRRAGDPEGGVAGVALQDVIDPLERWREHGEKPDFAGLPTFAGMPYTEDVADLRAPTW